MESSSSSSSSSLPTKGGRATLSNITGGDGGTMRSKMVGKVKLSRNNNNNNPVQSSTTKANENTTTSSSYFSALAATILAEEQVPPPPDKRLKSMDILIDKKLQGSPHLSVEDYHQQFWNNDAFYAAWLQQSLGKTNVHVGQWQTNTMASSNDENGVGGDLSAVIVNPWDGETYDCMRVVTFQFQRASTTTHCLSTTAGRSNPPAMMKAHVTQTQYCRVDEGMNRCVVSTTIATRGVPFSDAFNVQLRWVATRVLGAGPAASSYSSLHIQVGMVVVFTKPVIVANKIRAGIKEETTKSQVHLFRCMKKACSLNVDEELGGRAVPLPQASRRRKSAVDDLLLLAKDRVHVPASFHRRLAGTVGMCFPFLSKNDNGHDREVLQGEKNNNTVQDELDKVQRMLRTVRALPQSTTTMTAKDTQRAHVLSQCSVVQKALDAIVVRERYLEKSRAAAQRNRLAAQSSRNIKNNNGINNNDQQVPPALKTIAKLYDKMVDHVRSVTPRNLQCQNGPVEEAAFDAGPDPEPDKVLKGVNVIVSNTIHNATVMDVYKILAGGDDNDNDKLGESSSFYRSWLESTERRNVEFEPWSTAPPGEPCFADGWSNETFEKRRVVTARVLKSKFMNDAPPAVLAKQTMQQFCRLHDHDRLVMASSIKVDHFAFANTFEVCIRWVVSRVGSCDVSVKIGVFVLFLQPTMLESKIRTGALKESQRLQLDLFHRIRDAINSNNGSTGTTPRRFSFDDKMLASSMASRGSTIPTSAAWFLPIEQFCIPKMQKLTRLYPACMLEDDAALQHEFQQIQLQLQTVKLFLPAAGKETSSDLAATMENDDVGYNGENDKKASEKRSTFIQSELRVAYEALDNVVVWHGNAQYGKQTLAAASFVNNTSS